MSSPEQSPRPNTPISLQVFVHDSLERLCTIYASATNRTRDQILAEIVMPMSQDADLTGQSMLQSVEQVAKADPRAPGLILAPAAIALAYHTQCTAAIRDNDHDAAWSYMAQCRWWTATAIVVRHAPHIAAQVVAEAHSAMASSGGSRKAETYEPVRAEAYRLVRERHAKAPWPSKRKAAFAIAAEVLAFAKSRGITMSQDQIVTTLQNWLAEMPDRDELFPVRKAGAGK